MYLASQHAGRKNIFPSITGNVGGLGGGVGGLGGGVGGLGGGAMQQECPLWCRGYLFKDR